MLRKFIFSTIILILISGLIAPVSAQTTTNRTADFSASVATAWFELQLGLVQTTPGFSPPVASRAFGYSGVALYESVVGGMPEHQSLAGQLNEFAGVPEPEAGQAYHWPLVANSALATITRQFYAPTSAENHAAINALEASFEDAYKVNISQDVFNRSVAYGETISGAIFEWSMTDGGYQGYQTNFDTMFQIPVGDGMWISTPRMAGDPQPALQPHWGNNRPFALESGAECRAVPHPEYSETADTVFYDEALEVYNVSMSLTEEEKTIAAFWSDDPGQTATPPGHSISVLTQILVADDTATLDFAAEAYARLGIAVADAFIGCWNSKYTYNLLRPVTYIQEMFDADWMPILETPPFPEYPSGHSVQSGATEVILTSLFGAEFEFTDHTHDTRGFEPRTYASFAEMAQEAALSRLYGGIHYRAAIELGLDQGRCIGEQVNALQFRRQDA